MFNFIIIYNYPAFNLIQGEEEDATSDQENQDGNVSAAAARSQADSNTQPSVSSKGKLGKKSLAKKAKVTK